MSDIIIERDGIKSISVRGLKMEPGHNKYWPLHISLRVSEFKNAIEIIAHETLSREEFIEFVKAINEIASNDPGAE